MVVWSIACDKDIESKSCPNSKNLLKKATDLSVTMSDR